MPDLSEDKLKEIREGLVGRLRRAQATSDMEGGLYGEVMREAADALEAAEKERDAALAAIDKDGEPALMSRIIMRGIEDKARLEAAETRMKELEADLASDRKEAADAYNRAVLAACDERMSEQKHALRAAETRIRELEAGLEPFAALAERFGLMPDDEEIAVVRAGPRKGNAKLAHFRRARSLLQPQGEKDGA